jgi:hypothetical protein
VVGRIGKPSFKLASRTAGSPLVRNSLLRLGFLPNTQNAMALTPIVELGVAEAYLILTEQFRVVGLPPLDAIENEDWGRDLLLSRFLEIPAAELAVAGLCKDDVESSDERS